MGLPIQGTQVVIVSFISTPLAMIALGLRLWSRRLQRVSLAFNDYMAITAMVLATATVSVCLTDVFIGAIGVHADKLQATSPWVLTLYTVLFIPGQILWAAANTSVKLSILSLYAVIFPSKTFCRVCYATMVVSAAYFLSVLLETFLLCDPVQFNWDKTIPNGKCHNQNLAYLLAGITNIVIDAFIVALPVPKLYGLHIPLAKRIAIGAMFGLGALICVLSLLRILSVLSWNLADSTYTGTGIAVYSILEPTLGVVNACLPTTRPALKVLFKNGPFSWSQKSIHGSHISKTQNSHQFERLKDDVALNNIQVVSSQQGMRPQGKNITVLREWDVSLSRHGDELVN
ncbi:hypothetical protein F4679DRAFT_581464 [Xylaria curta]|nr:hypothetical protein F4679DRAFT_581464 [Xylaria curta]